MIWNYEYLKLWIIYIHIWYESLPASLWESKWLIFFSTRSDCKGRGSLTWEFVDATPFPDAVKKTKRRRGEQIQFACWWTWFHVEEKMIPLHYGTERLYSGYLGVELKCEIVMWACLLPKTASHGLKHILSFFIFKLLSKSYIYPPFQVRSTGLLDQLTRQPFKGKRRGGGIRFGEMERDSLLCLLIKLPIYYMTGSSPL